MDLHLDQSVDRSADTFPRQYARTQRLTLGEPRDLTITHGGSTVVFARSRGGSDPVNCLWSIDVASGIETLLADPVELLADVAADRTDLPPEERARRERLREGAGGVTAYSLSDDGRRATFALAGLLFVTDLATTASSHLPVDGPVFDPRLSPDGERIAYVQGPALWSTDLRGNATLVVGEAGIVPTVRWGSADFVAAEEMGRHRGHWWGPDSRVLAVCRVDDAPVPEWFISDPADPSVAPVAVRYPSAGSPNPVVTLHLCHVDGSAPIDVTWDGDALPYLAKVEWNAHGLAITVQRRDQRSVEVRRVDPVTGSTTPVWVDHDEAWVELVPGTGVFVDATRVVVCADRDGSRRLVVGGDVVSPADIQVRGVVDADADRVVVVGNPIDDATVQHVYRWRAGSFETLTDVPGVHTAVASGDTTVIRTATLDQPRGQWMLPAGTPLRSVAERPLVRPLVTMRPHHGDTPAIAVLFPTDHDGGPLPVLLDPYGGPHAQRTVQSSQAFCTSQWFADQGFAVVVADGRGTPGRGTTFERAVHGDLASAPLADQVVALHTAAERHPELDLERVAIRGWSFGGYLAALAVLDRPDVFHAAIAGAPVTEWRLYDTHYTERYLGDPAEHAERYDASSLLGRADRLTRPLLVIHGLADDNVVAAHTLRMSSALLAAGRPHEVLPLVGVTHMTPQEVVAENLLLHQLDFLRRALHR